MDDAATSGAPGTSFVILSVAIVGILATALLLLSYYLFLTRCGLLFFWRSDHRDVAHHHLHIVVQEQPASRRGLEEAAIRRIPTFRYQSGSNKQECAVCLAEFRDGERLRQLPPCLHAFHIDCIDAWLQSTANCPLCRAAVSAADRLPLQVPAGASHDDIVIDISDLSAAEEPCQHPMTARRSLSMDSSTDKRFYLALQRTLQQQQQPQQQVTREEDDVAKSSGESSSIPTPRRLRRAFFSFSQSRSATILPL
uniref:RING-type E3 ubiquitin transferase n=1 Tax=Eragrostis tef TaxID=110835 RepID=J9QEZ1_ERATE|nr:hypothetical protein [Eragrostis tef]